MNQFEIILDKKDWRYEAPHYTDEGKPYVLLCNGKIIAKDTEWNSPNYLINLKRRLEKGEPLTAWTCFKAKFS